MYVGEGCTGCGICFYACPEPGAIKVYKKTKTTDDKKACDKKADEKKPGATE
jgi:Fe-S-cluster-containing hydrogenase component 2